MSHVAAAETIVLDQHLSILKHVCNHLGLKFVEGAKTIRWFGRWVNDYDAKDAAYRLGIDTKDYGTCEHRIEVPGCNYDIGLIKNPKGQGYMLYYDFFGEGGKIKEQFGQQLGGILQPYATAVAYTKMVQAGYEVQKIECPNGEIKLVCEQT